jgi:hypothetical protein
MLVVPLRSADQRTSLQGVCEVAPPAAGDVGEVGARDEKRKAKKMEHGGSVCRREMQRSHLEISSDYGVGKKPSTGEADSPVRSEASEGGAWMGS